jgi:predicted dehydrogenase
MSTDLKQDWPAPSRRRPIVIFGAGSIVRDAHLPAWAAGGYDVAGVYDPDEEKSRALAADYGLRALSEAEALSVEGAVYDLATPPAAHAGVLSKLPKGAPALVQKPMGSDLAGASDVLTACRARDLIAAMNFQLRFAPMSVALKDAIDKGLLGDVVDIEMHAVLATPWERWEFLKGLPRIEITMHSIHYLDLIRHLIGDPKGVHAKTIGHPAHEVAQTRTAAILDYGEKVRCALSINHDWDYGRPHQACEMRIAGIKGAAYMKLGVNLDYPNGEPDILELNTGRGWQTVSLSGSWFTESFTGRMHNLQRAVNGEESLIAPVEDGWRTMALVEACFASSAAPMTPIKETP